MMSEEAFNKWRVENYPDLHEGYPYYRVIRQAFMDAWRIASEPMPCGHPAVCTSGTGDTNFCVWCKAMAEGKSAS